MQLPRLEDVIGVAVTLFIVVAVPITLVVMVKWAIWVLRW